MRREAALSKTAAFSALILALALACFAFQALAQEMTTLSKIRIQELPFKVIAHAEGNEVTLHDLKYDNGKVSVGYTNKVDQPFTLVLYCDLKDELLIVYSDPESILTLHSSGMVLFGLSGGYTRSGDNKQGTISLGITRKVFRGFDVSGDNARIYAFAIKGRVYSNSIIPGEQKAGDIFNAWSNVLALSSPL